MRERQRGRCTEREGRKSLDASGTRGAETWCIKGTEYRGHRDIIDEGVES